jgi:C1A family cysteine protease
MIFIALLAVAFANDYLLEKEFYQFKAEHNKNYTTYEEHLQRFEVYKANKVKIATHNKAKRSWTLAMNQFGDMTSYEFSMYVKRGAGGGYVPRPESERNVKTHVQASCTSVDWDDKGAVTPVKNQGQCGSCWSFSTTGAIEGRAQIAKGTLASLSEQELVDCDTVDSACQGGLMDYGFEYVINNNGLCSEVEYPYVSGTTTKKGTCERSSCSNKFDAITSYTDVASDSQDQLESALCDGPVSIAIEADQEYFQFYNDGVLDGSGCGANLDHGVLLVGMGYDSDSGSDYWKVKNSWGVNWGEAGYIRMCRNCGMNNGAGQCGLLKQPSYPVV